MNIGKTPSQYRKDKGGAEVGRQKAEVRKLEVQKSRNQKSRLQTSINS